MKILIACEESQTICSAFRAKGYEAYSCDIVDCSGGHPEWHIKDDALKLINGNCEFVTVDGAPHKIEGKWDLLIAHPPCTYLSNCGNRWLNVEKYGDKARERLKNREEAVEFFMAFANADCDKIAIENPIGCMSTRWRKPDQIIEPYMFGDPFEKKTCLWLKGLPKLKETNRVQPEDRVKFDSGKSMPAWYSAAWGLSKEERSRVRSKTFPGIAEAIAAQWSK